MEQEKTLEELKAENESLKSQITEINEKVKDIGALLLEGKERNLKLAYSIRLFAEAHFTREEKMAIAAEFDRAINAEQVEKVYLKHKELLNSPDFDVEPDFLWSPGFTRELEKYYFKHKGYNPFEVVDNAVKTIRKQFMIENDLMVTDDPQKVETLRQAWQSNKELAVMAVDEILEVTNEILRK
ncbi:MAG TPA: hypothetical protein V6C58_11945 [Allocoleopsis sp.]